MIMFEWDAAKAKKNIKQHGVTFEEARSIFFDDYARQFFDEEHSQDEDRFLMLGVSINSRVLIVCHCEREQNSEDEENNDMNIDQADTELTIRIISARKAKPDERTYYEGPLP